MISSNEPHCLSVNILSDSYVEGCEAFFIGYEVEAAFSGIATVPRDQDKSVVVIEDNDGVWNGFLHYKH